MRSDVWLWVIYADYSGSGCGEDGSGGICAASTRTASFVLASCHVFVVLLAVCLPVCLSECLSVCLQPTRLLFAFPPTHPYSWWKRVTPRGDACTCLRVCVCRCACAQDLIGLRSEGILRTESQVERGSRDPTVLSIMHFPLFLAPPPPPPPPRAHQRSCGDGTRCLFIRLNSVWSSANSAHICRTDFKDHRLWERYITLGFSEKKAEKKTTGCRFQDDIWFFYFSKHDGPQMPPVRNETFRLLCSRLYIDVEGGKKEIFFFNSEKKVLLFHMLPFKWHPRQTKRWHATEAQKHLSPTASIALCKGLLLSSEM